MPLRHLQPVKSYFWKWWHFWPYWPVPSLMGSVLLRGEIPSFLSTTIWKDLDEVWTWESRYLGHLHHICQHFHFERSANNARELAQYKDLQFTQKPTSRRVWWWHSDKISPGLKIDGYGSQRWDSEATQSGAFSSTQVHYRVGNECGGAI